MKVTGNTLIAFEKWLVNNESIQDLNNVDSRMHHWITYKGFKNLPDDMKIGVFISFFDSVGIYIEDNLGLNEGIFGFMIHSGKGIEGYNFLVSSEPFTTRNESNTAAVEKADELFNSRA